MAKNTGKVIGLVQLTIDVKHTILKMTLGVNVTLLQGRLWIQ